MKKLSSFFVTLFILFSVTAVCYAGDIPETQLSEDDSQTFIGEVKELTPDSITVIQKYNFKGEFEKDREYTYKDKEEHRPEYVKVGATILCCYCDENNFYTYEIKSFNNKKIELAQDNDMAKRLQNYINDGLFEKAEEERLARVNADAAKATASPEAVIEQTKAPVTAPSAVITPRPRNAVTPRPRVTRTPRPSAKPNASTAKNTSSRTAATPTPKPNPKTGDYTPIVGAAGMMALAAALVIELKKNRN